MSPYIYRHLHIDKSTEKRLAKLIKDLILSGGQITSMGSLCNGFSESKFSYWETDYTIQFMFQKQVDDFENRGWKTWDPELVSANVLTSED